MLSLPQLTENGGGTGHAGGTLEIAPASGEAPKYLDDRGFPNAEQTATSSAGLGFIFNVEPGQFASFARPPGDGCVPHPMAPANEDGSVRTQVLAGMLTLTVFDCAAP